jgi:hypothetical protein
MGKNPIMNSDKHAEGNLLLLELRNAHVILPAIFNGKLDM